MAFVRALDEAERPGDGLRRRDRQGKYVCVGRAGRPQVNRKPLDPMLGGR